MSAEFSTVRHIKARPEALAISLRNYQSELSPDERLTFWAKLIEGYCDSCGEGMKGATGNTCSACLADEIEAGGDLQPGG